MTKQTNKKRRKPTDFPFQFSLKINGHIICKRGFYVNDYNPDVKLSFELRELMDRVAGMGNESDKVMGIIPSHLKAQSSDYMWSKYNPFFVYSNDKSRPRQEIRKDFFTFTISEGDEIISESVFENKFMLYSLENQVDITKIVPDIIKEIEYYFSLDEYTFGYLGMDLRWKSGIWKYGEKKLATA